ncbi:hypothetical protein ACH5RR_040478 [Cinchona calisaya]|uniref:Wall-associated receptor kinase galacturonan-binding domain-containing protein n=1 Tax=Cinchona calisaya TaxID=153742 RepID=A0ABD2XT25_9GENT
MVQLQFLAVFSSFVLVIFYFNYYRWYSLGEFLENICYDTGWNPYETSCNDKRFSCGNNSIILNYPFGVKDDPYYNCSSYFEMSCEHNRIVIYTSSEKYFLVENSINYGSRSLRVVDFGVQRDNCSTLPLSSFNYYNYYYDPYYSVETELAIYVSCKNPVLKTKNSPTLYVDTSPCITATKDDLMYNYVVVGKNLVASDIQENCTVLKFFPADLRALDIGRRNVSFQDIHNLLVNGIELGWGDDTGRVGSKSSICKCTASLSN